MSKPLRIVLSLAVAVATGLLAGPAPVAATGEPAGYEHLHTYAEITDELAATAAAHPDIAAVSSIGHSYEGREIWAIKISDNVGLDENEPEVFVNSLIHARERVAAEMSMYLIALLTGSYGVDSRITSIVDGREIWILPMVNPDGAEYDMSDGVFRHWRKNRQPVPGSDAIGVDLNRQFDFAWGCCGGAGANPYADKYRGPAPWFAPETVAYRDFINSRVVDGRQQIRTSISFHSSGRLVLFPYAYTRANRPLGMTRDDRRAFVSLARAMAAINTYRPIQTSDLYIVAGDQDDWSYHQHGIFAFGIELARGRPLRDYPAAEQVAADLARNGDAVLLLLEQADCPWRLAGLAAAHCP